jgi:hypothetical protein
VVLLMAGEHWDLGFAEMIAGRPSANFAETVAHLHNMAGSWQAQMQLAGELTAVHT